LVCPYAWDRFGGVQSHIRALARTLEERGHEVSVLAPSTLNPLGHERAVDESGVRFTGRAIGIPANGSVAPLSFGPMAAVSVRNALRESAPDVVHLHEPLIPSVSFLALWNAEAPTVGTFHAAAESSVAYRLSRTMLSRTIERLTVRTAVSDAARKLISSYHPGEYLLTPNGVEVERFARAEPLDLGLGPKILFVGRIERRKGLEVLIQAMTRLTDLDPELIVAGTGPQERAGRALAENLGVRARFLGRVSDDELPRLYRAADVYCAPGLGGESFGIVLIEAMAAGAPVVCSDLEGYRAVAGAAASLVPPSSAGDLADALRAVLTDENAAARMSKMSRRMVEMFSWKRLAAGVEQVYERAVSSYARS
ncbi:MAG TPA: glycosyltransferase family 4 protein, partial [Actinomycetota bacterium]|nr:glycosyltransferase family 4 protein [Actinomycetota bacterium]